MVGIDVQFIFTVSNAHNSTETISDSDAILGTTKSGLELGAMVDWLMIWGATQAVGFVFKPILEDLAKESVKDYAKDFFKDCLKKVIRLPEKDAQKAAYGKALKEFLQLVQQELEDADYQEAQIRQYTQPLKRFVEQADVAAALGQAFEIDSHGLNTHTLVKTWKGLDLPYLPEEFDWERVSKRYLKKVRAIVRESDELRSIFEAEAQGAIAENMQELVGIAPEFNLSRYAEGLREQYGNLKLESLDTTGVYYSELKLWKIFIPQTVRECQEFLPQVYEIPKEHGRRLRESGQLDKAEIAETELERYRKVYIEQPIRPVLEVVGDPTVPVGTFHETSLSSEVFRGAFRETPLQYAVVLGDPGSGKSTLLQYIALAWAERPLNELPLHSIPLLIELRTYARDKRVGQCRDILTFLHGGNIAWRLNQQRLHEELKAGRVIALFDGVDEVFDPELRDEVVTDIHRFTNDYPNVQVIVTSRWLGYKAQRLRDAGFRHFMLQDLDDEQIEAFIQRWHDLTFLDNADKVRKRERLQKAVQDSKSIRELAGNPLLLTMMAILNRNQELPRDRPELYNQASRVLLHQWDVERALIEDHRLDPKTIDYRDKQAMLRKVAYHMQSSEKGLAGNIISATDLENILTDYLKTIEVAQPRTIARLMINQLRTRNFILCFLGADSYAFVHRTFLEYFCAWEFVWQFKETQTLTLEQLRQEVYGQHWQDESWHEVLRLIAGMIDAKFAGEVISYLIEDNSEKGKFENILLATECFGEIGKRNSLKEISERLLDTLENAIKYELECELEEIANINRKKAPHENEFHLYPSTDNISERALSLIVRVWEGEPVILPLLKRYVQPNNFWDVQDRALQELSQYWKDDPDTLPTIKMWIRCAKQGNVSETAIKELAKRWKDNSDTFSILKSYALSGNDFLGREQAVQELAEGWKASPETFEILKEVAQQDDTYFVRRKAIQKLVLYSKDKSCVFDILYNLALRDPFERKEDWQINPRQAALEGIVNHYPDHPRSLELLNDRAQNDPDEQVRSFAAQQLAKLRELREKTNLGGFNQNST